MKAGKAVAWIGLAMMTLGLANGFINGDFLSDGAKLMANPWGVMSMIDLYVGFALFSVWIVFREKSFAKSFAWVIMMMVLGFFTACIYVLNAFYKSNGDWLDFYLGARKDEIISRIKA
ncbi:MAG TPA: DUF1475 family protein [Clostridia bacterium]|nr:DUF1475 family protein [Clostridia bacterium]